MPWSWISRDDIRIIAIAGICKNAGKTSLLNAILGAKPDISFGVLSTGIDGEDLDTVFHSQTKGAVTGGQPVLL